MRVTKVIREYVESEVRRKFAPLRYSVEDEYNSAVDPIQKKIIEIAKEANEKAVAVATEAGLYDLKMGELIRPNAYRVCDDAAAKVRRDKLKEISDKELKAISEIIISIELGETTKDKLRSTIDALEI